MKNDLSFKKFLVIFIFFSTISVIAQNSSEALQREAKKLAAASLSAGGSVFAKADYKKADEFLNDANELIKENKNPEKAIEYLNQANELFKKSIDAAKSMNPNFPALMKIRQMVLNHGLSENTLKIWKDAEDNFITAFENYMDKDNEDVKKYGSLAEQLYKDAELVSIKDQYFQDIKLAVTKAEDEKLENYAPKTLIKIKQLITDAENVLNANRYDTLTAKKIVSSALYEINHGTYMQGVFTQMNKEDKTWEDLQLKWEEPLAKIATDLKVTPLFDSEAQNVTGKILESINLERNKLSASQKESQNLKTEIAQLNKTIEETKTALADSKNLSQKLSKDLDSTKKANEGLTKILEEQKGKLVLTEQENLKFKADSETIEKNQKLIESVSTMFLPSEAEVIKSGDLLTIRMVNLNFAQNKTTLESQYFGLLNKIQKAIQTFPKGTVVIEGHTDGVGDFQKNIELSQGRANAVYQYLISTMGADAARITVVGLGGSKPIANNSSEEGRSKNRRIEVVINPKLETNK